METSEVEAFLTLAEELHFTRTAERLRLSQPRVSRLISSLERKVGGSLFTRTSRQVTLTPLGERLRDRVAPAWSEMEAAFRDARDDARNTEGTLRLGWTVTASGPAVHRLARTFSDDVPRCELAIYDVPGTDAYGPLRRGEIDVLAYWLAGDEPDLTAGPVIEYRDRALVVRRGHRLAERESVSVEDLADEEVNEAGGIPAPVWDALCPPRAPSGRPVRRVHSGRGIEGIIAGVSRGLMVHPTVAGVATFQRGDVVTVPIRDLPPMPLGLLWCTASENARIRALAEVARRAGPYRSMREGHGSMRETPLAAASPPGQGGTHGNRRGNGVPGAG